MIFLLVELMISIMMWFVYLNYKQNYAEKVIDRIDIAFRTTVNSYAMISQTLYEEILNTPKIIDVFKHAHKANKVQQAQIRQQLFQILNPTYQRLTQKNLRQLHFHLPDNTSFLRFHKPQKFGDNLSKIRRSVVLANQYKRKIQGFEEGKVFNGFRYVFPLFDEKQHIGSVEASVSFDALSQEIRKIYGLDYAIMLKKEIVAKKLFSSELKNYVPCLLDNNFLCESNTIRQQTTHDDNHKLLNALAKQLKNNVELNSGQGFVKNVQLDNIFYEVVFYPLYNIQNQQVAYAMTYSQNDSLCYLQNVFIIFFISFSLINGLFLIFLYQKNKNSQIIAEKNKHLVRLNQDKNEFLGIVAHDLKNPLQAIQGSAELIEMTLQEEKLQSKQELFEFTQMISISVERMFNLITNLLDVNAIESGKVKIDLQKQDILPILQRIVDEYRKKAEPKQLKLHIDLPKNECYAYIDRNSLHQVLDNLVSNAVKYSHFGKNIYIQVSVQASQLLIKIKDEGPGLSQADQNKLFGKFARLTPKPTGNEHSTGLGLFIVKKLVEAMKGQIWCESQEGYGSTFIVVFEY